MPKYYGLCFVQFVKPALHEVSKIARMGCRVRPFFRPVVRILRPPNLVR